MWETLGVVLQPVISVSSSLLSPLRTQPLPVKAPEGFTPQPDTATQDIDEALEVLHKNKDSWPAVSCKDRAALLDVILFRMSQHLRAAAESAVKAKGSYGSGLGEEMQSWLPAALELTDLRQAMLEEGQPKPTVLSKRRNGQLVAKVFPKSTLGLLFAGWSTEVWVQAGKEGTQGQVYRDKAAGVQKPGAVSLVLGAGNQVAVIVADVLHKLIHMDEVVLVKMNPVNDYLGPHLEAIMEPFMARGVLKFVYGGAQVGKYLVNHDLVDNVHMTGSVATFNNIVWGSPTPPATGGPVSTKPVTAELGNVSPVLVVPGPWSDSDLQYHADIVVSNVLSNGGFNCSALQVLVTDKSWPLREKFLDAIRASFNKTAKRLPWYPGSPARYEAFKAKFPTAEALGGDVSFDGASPCLMAAGLSPDEAKVDLENWVPVFQEVAIPNTDSDPGKFLSAAVKFANDRCWGTLTVALLIHPSTQRTFEDSFQTALEDLKYGSIAVNGPSHLGYGIPSSTWGGYVPGYVGPHDIGSGNCYVHNSSLFDHPDKSVVTAPWRVSPKPLWSVTNTNLEALVPRVVDLLYSSSSPMISLMKLPFTAFSAMLG